MTEAKEKSWVKKIFPGWLKESDDHRDGELPSEPSDPESPSRKQATQTGDPSVEVSQTASTIAGKLAILKKALEFEGKDKSRLAEIGTSQELLVYIYDVVLFKFDKLHEIGLLSSKSADAVGSINRKLETFLAGQAENRAADPKSLEDLKAENEALKQKYEALQAKHLQTGVITDREIEIEKECNYLKARIRELETFLRIAKKQIGILSSTAEMVQSLRAKNSLLGSKVDHQARLLKSLTAGQPEHQELLSTIERLHSENSLMKTQLDGQEALLEQFQTHLPADSSEGELLKGLVDQSMGLMAELAQSQDRLDTLSIDQSDADVLGDVDRLQDENIQLKNRLEANQSLSQMLSAYQEKGEESGVIEKMMQHENQRLQQLLAAKKEQIKILSNNPANRPFVQAVTRLKDENRQLRRISNQKAGYVAELLAERKQLQDKLRQYLTLARESKRIRAELEFSKKLVASYRKVEYQYELLKKKYSEARNKYEIANNEKTVLQKKLNRLNVEYNALVQEYENLFGKS